MNTQTDLAVLLPGSDAIEVTAEFDRLVVALHDVPSVPRVVRRLVEILGVIRRQAGSSAWRLVVETLRDHEIGRLLRTDPMIRRCQWRQPGDSPYAIVEAFAMGWDDAGDCLVEAEEPGFALNAAVLNHGLAVALRERRNVLHSLIARAARTGYRPAILGLGAGRAPEIELLTPGDPLPIARWLSVDAAGKDEPSRRRGTPGAVERILADPADWLAAGTEERFDLVYAVDALDGLAEREAVAFLGRALALLRPNGRLVVSAFPPDMPEAGLMEAVLDWAPVLRDPVELQRLLAAVAPGEAACSGWLGTSDRAAFAMAERQAWAG